MSMRDRVVEMKEEVESLRKEYQDTLATEMLRELKAQNKRQHITIIVLIAVIVAMIIGFFIYENQFETVGDNLDMYIRYTQAFINDEDARPGKVAIYLLTIPK